MAIIGVNDTNTSFIGQALQDANAGDEVSISGGPYVGNINLTTGTSKASEVIIRAASASAPPVINGRIQLQGQPKNLTFRRLNFVGTEFDTGSNGVKYPTASEPLRFDDNRGGIKIFACLFDFYLNGLKFQRCENGGAEVAYCNFERMCVDPLMVYGVMPTFYFHHNAIINQLTDPARRTGAGNESRHPDTTHIRPNKGQVDTNPMAGLRIEFNLVDDPTGMLKGFFCNSEQNTVGVGFTDAIFFNNDINLGRYAGIELTGGTNSLIERNRLRAYDAGVKEKPSIEIEMAVSTGTIRNNVTARGPITFKGGALASKFTLTNNSVSTTASPTDFVPMVNGVNCGIGAFTGDGGATAPAQMADEWSNPPTNTVAKDGRVATYVALGLTPERYTGIVVIPAASVAWPVVSLLSTVPGTDVSDTLGWIRTGVATRKGMRVANPATNAAGARRFEMIGGSGGNLDIYSVLAGGSMSDITLTYSVGGIWAAMSPYTGGFTAPGTPPVEVKPTALTSGQWAFVGAVQEISPGRFARDFKITVAHTGAKWVIDGETLARPLAIVGLDSGANVYRLQPLDTGAENTVGYLQTRSFRAVYSTDTVFSDPSADAKSFTGPAAPPPPTPYDPGETLDRSGFLTASGFVVQIPFPNQVAAPPGEISVDLVSAAGRATVYYTGALPSDAVGLLVLYGAKVYIVRDGRARMPLKPGLTFGLLCGYDAAGQIGHARHFFVG